MRMPKKVTKRWLSREGLYPCHKAEAAFFKRWPDGLTVSRRNLYLVAKEHPVSWLWWFGWVVLRRRFTISVEEWAELEHLSMGPNSGDARSPAKKRAFAVALADKMGLS